MKAALLSILILAPLVLASQEIRIPGTSLPTLNMTEVLRIQSGSPRIPGIGPENFLIPDWVSPGAKGNPGDYLYAGFPGSSRPIQVPYDGCRLFLGDNRGLVIDGGKRTIAYSAEAGATLFYGRRVLRCMFELESVSPSDPSSSYFAAYLEDDHPEKLGRSLSKVEEGKYYFFALDRAGKQLVFLRVQSSADAGLVLWIFM
jgi:hypothetical protein